jgi:hypothetical protein
MNMDGYIYIYIWILVPESFFNARAWWCSLPKRGKTNRETKSLRLGDCEISMGWDGDFFFVGSLLTQHTLW